MGAEPDRIDVGEHEGLRLFSQEETKGLNLMRRLTEVNQKKAQLSIGMDTKGGLAEDRWNPFDERCVVSLRSAQPSVTGLTEWSPFSPSRFHTALWRSFRI